MKRRTYLFCSYLYFICIILIFLITLLVSFDTLAFTTDSPSYVVEVIKEEQNIHGSGFFINETTLVTNAHVCILYYDLYILGRNFELAKKLKVKTKTGHVFNVDNIKILNDTDLCIAKSVQKMSAGLIKFDHSFKLEETLKVQSPNKYPNSNLIYSGVDKVNDLYSKYHKNSHVALGKGQAGMSGSPILNNQGLIVGVFWGVHNSSDIVYFIHIDELKRLINE